MTRYRHLITDENRKWWTLGAMCFALFMIMLDNTVVNVALPSIQRDLGASISGLEWTINGYTLSFAVLLATGGRLGDIFGRRRMFLIGVVDLRPLLGDRRLRRRTRPTWSISRVVQGVGAALMMPGDALDHHRRLPRRRARQGDGHLGRASPRWRWRSARSSAASSPSTSAGGRSSTSTSRSRSGAVAATLFAVRESRDTTVGREVDYLGVAALTGALTALVLALVEGNSWGWGSPEIVALLAGAVVGLVAFVAIELRVRAPMVEFRFFADRNFLGAVVVALIITFAMMGVFFFLALYMQDILGYSPLEAGVRFLPSTLMIVARGAGRRPARRPLRPALADRRRPGDPRRCRSTASPGSRSTPATSTCCPASCCSGSASR